MTKRYTSVIINSTSTLEQFYQERLDYLSKYHAHPTKLTLGLTNSARIREEVHRLSHMDDGCRDAAGRAGLDIDKSSIADLFAAGICNRHGLT